LAGRERRWAHDSRLLGILTTSGGILRTTAETLDYQFGFKVSETWFFKFMERAIAPLIVFQVATLYLLTCFVVVEQGEEAVVERFGAPRSGKQVLGPGIHLKWPWPIECVYKHRVKRVEMLEIGEQLKEDVAGYTWTVSHAKQPFSLLVANRQLHEEEQADGAEAPAAAADVPAVSLLAGTVYVYYYVDDFYNYLYTHKDPRRTLEQLCYRELTHYAARSDFLELLGYKIGEAANHLQGEIQDEADRLKLGVRVTHVTLRGLHPPPLAGESFEAVVGALEEKEAKILNARKDAVSLVAGAEAEAHRKTAEAQAYSHRRRSVTPAVADRFNTQYAAYQTAPEVFLHRTHVRSLEEQQAEARKFVLPEWVRREVLELNLEEKLPPGLGFGMEASEIDEGTLP
jgi:regulator of protease activity HflC (stomatin/prohibitin superfamily)